MIRLYFVSASRVRKLKGRNCALDNEDRPSRHEGPGGRKPSAQAEAFRLRTRRLGGGEGLRLDQSRTLKAKDTAADPSRLTPGSS